MQLETGRKSLSNKFHKKFNFRLGEILDIKSNNISKCEAAISERQKIIETTEKDGEKQLEEAKVSAWEGFVDEIRENLLKQIDNWRDEAIRETNGWSNI